MDVISQAFFRGIYLFQNDIKLGNFDYIITKPVSPLFYSLTRLTDILDSIFLIPIIVLLLLTMMKLKIMLSLYSILLYLVFLFFGILIILGLHIISACVTIWVLENESFIWFYRDSMTITRFPPEIFSSKIQFIFTYIMPVIIIVGIPVKALLGKVTTMSIIISLVVSMVFLIGSLIFWNFSLKHYSSASS